MRGLKVPIVIGVMFAFLWIAGPQAATAQRNCPSAPPPTGSAPLTGPPCPTPTLIIPSDFPSFPPSDPPPTDPPPPVTGADLTRFVILGAGLTLAGTGLVRLARKASDHG